MSSLQSVHPIIFLIVATAVEVSGDAVIRIALYDHAGVNLARTGLFLGGTALLLGYGIFLNLAPLEFRQVVGLYIATLFVIWQIVNFAMFRTLPSLPILVGGAMIVVGGAIVTFWRPAN